MVGQFKKLIIVLPEVVLKLMCFLACHCSILNAWPYVSHPKSFSQLPTDQFNLSTARFLCGLDQSFFSSGLCCQIKNKIIARRIRIKFLGNVVMFVVLYVLFMLPGYFLPYIGSNSAGLSMLGAATGVPGANPFFWLHLGSLVILVVITWFRGDLLEKKWLVIFPILATVFDLLPILSFIPLVPTLMHLLALILGVVGAKATVPLVQ